MMKKFAVRALNRSDKANEITTKAIKSGLDCRQVLSAIFFVFDNMNRDDINILFSNKNSYSRKSLKGKTPYQTVLHDPRLGKEFIGFININKVDCDDVTLNP